MAVAVSARVVLRLVLGLFLDRAGVLLVQVLDRVEHAAALLHEELLVALDVHRHEPSLLGRSGCFDGFVGAVLLVDDGERRTQKRPDPDRLAAQMLPLGERPLLDEPRLGVSLG